MNTIIAAEGVSRISILAALDVQHFPLVISRFFFGRWFPFKAEELRSVLAWAQFLALPLESAWA